MTRFRSQRPYVNTPTDHFPLDDIRAIMCLNMDGDDVVKKDNLDHVPTAKELATSIAELVEQQKKTDEQLRETDEQLKENAEQQKKTDEQLKETDELLKENAEQQKKTDELQKETEKQLKKTIEGLDDLGKKLGYVERIFGDMAEYVSWKNLQRVLAEQAGIIISGIIKRYKRNYEEQEYEVDLLAVGNRDVVAVEVKTTLRVKDVKKLSSIMLKFTKIFPEYARHQNIYGGVAYMKAHEGTEKLARKHGLLTIHAIGKSAQIEGLDDGKNLRNFKKVD